MKKRLEGFKKLLESNKYLEEFDRAVFESIVDKIIIGGTNDEGEIDPAMITIIYKTGKKDSQDGRLFKSRRKNAKEVNEETGGKLYPQSSDEVNNLYSYPIDNTCGIGGTDDTLWWTGVNRGFSVYKCVFLSLKNAIWTDDMGKRKTEKDSGRKMNCSRLCGQHKKASM